MSGNGRPVSTTFERPLALLFATSGHSGVDRIVANLLPEFGRVDRRFHLLTIGGHGPAVPQELPANIRHLRLPVGTKKLVALPLAAYLLRHRPEALLTANHQLNRAALLARRFTGVSTRVIIRMGMSLSAMGAEMKPRRRDALFRSMRRWYPLADAAVTPSLGVAEDLRTLAGVPEQRLHMIRNPLINDSFLRKSEEPLAHPWFDQPGVPVILGAGSLEPRKDFSTLIRAFAQLRQERPARLIILGEGRQRPALEALSKELGVSGDVQLPGYEANPYRYMRQADVFVLSSRREGASAVIIEAMACGTPVVSTDCPSGPAEALEQGRYGRLVPIGDAESMAAAIRDTLANPPEPALLSEAVRENAAALAARRYLAAMGVTLP